jgi:hypothetical protein
MKVETVGSFQSLVAAMLIKRTLPCRRRLILFYMKAMRKLQRR